MGSPIKLVMLAVASCWSINLNADTLNIASLEFCPYVCGGSTESKKPAGFVYELEKAILERAGYKVIFHIVPYIRALKGTERGEYDAVAISNDTSSDVNICSNETIGPMIYTFYVKTGTSWRYSGVQSLRKVIYGTVAGYDDYTLLSQEVHDYVSENKHNENRIQIHHGTSDVLYRMFRRMELGRIDTLAEASYVADFHLQQYGLKHRFQKAGHFKKILWGRMCFNPLDPKAHEYAQIIDAGMKELRSSGELEAIMKKYGLDVWEPEKR